MKHFFSIKLWCLLAVGVACIPTNAQIVLPQILGNDMVLQQGEPIPVWGKATPGEKITVTFFGKLKSTVANDSGKWTLDLPKEKASFTPRVMEINGSNGEQIVLHNILVGEVWLCSGQSNMAYTMRMNSKVAESYYTGKSKHSPIDELQYAHNKNIRIFLADRKRLAKPHPDHDGWSVAEDSALRSFSAPGYFFAKELFEKLNVPIGIISSAVPGSPIERWLAGKFIKQPEENQPDKIDYSQPGTFYELMIKPLAPFSIKGILWYQGENNCFENDSINYTYKMAALIDQYRKLWKDKKLPFYYTQIAPFYYSKSKNQYNLNKETLPRFWEAQTLVKKIPFTDMIVTTDLPDNLNNIHPPGKWVVGERLAYLALKHNYSENMICHGPEYESKTVEGNQLIVHFRKQKSELISKDGKPLTYFEIAGSDGKFYPADAKIISGDVIELTSPEVQNPVNARFAWNEAAQPNLFNEAGLPAEPFRTNNPYTHLKL